MDQYYKVPSESESVQCEYGIGFLCNMIVVWSEGFRVMMCTGIRVRVVISD